MAARPLCCRAFPARSTPSHSVAMADASPSALAAGLARSGVVRVYDVPGGTLLHEFEGHGDVVVGLAFRPDGGQLASASYDQTLRFWDLVVGRASGVFRGHSDFVYDVAYDRAGKTVFSVSKDREVKRIDLAKFKERRTYSDHNDDILALAVAPDGSEFVTAGNEPQLRWWKSDEDKPQKRQGGHGGPVFQLAFSGNGAKLISASGDGTVRLWDGQTGASLKTLTTTGPRGGNTPPHCRVTPRSRLLAAGTAWCISGTPTQESSAPRSCSLSGDNPDALEWLAVAPSGFVASSPALSKLLRWRVGGTEVSNDCSRGLFSRDAAALARALVAPIDFTCVQVSMFTRSLPHDAPSCRFRRCRAQAAADRPDANVVSDGQPRSDRQPMQPRALDRSR